MFFRKKEAKSPEVKTPEQPQAKNPTCFARLVNAGKHGFDPKVIFDCGASVGNWAKRASQIFPGARILAVEPIDKIIAMTRENLQGVDPPVEFFHGAVGREKGKAHLNIWDNEETKMSGSSLKDHVQGDPRERLEVQVETIDGLAENFGHSPHLLKLDLQGGELDALRGAPETLKSCEMVIVEFGCLEAYVGRTTPRQLMDLMYDNDYCLYDVVDLGYRPYDDALMGGDFFFVKNASVLRKYKGYK